MKRLAVWGVSRRKAAVGFVTMGCLLVHAAACGSNEQSGDQRDASTGADGNAGSPCGAGTTFSIAVAARQPSGGEVIAFADCQEAGAIGPIATEGGCSLYGSATFTPAATYLPHGAVRAIQPSSSLDVSIASEELSRPFTQALRSDAPIFVDIEGAAGIARQSVELVVPKTLAATVSDSPHARSKALEVGVAGGTASETIVLSLVAGSQEIRCRTEGTTGTITLTPSLLTKLDAGPATIQIVSEIGRPNTDGLTATVRVAAVNGSRTIALE